MAIYERAYRAYAGPVTGEATRFLVLPRYAFEGVFASKLFTGFFALCFVPSLVGAVLVYLHHNLKALEVMGLQPQDLIRIDASFFQGLLSICGMMLGFVLTLVVGPGLISRDLVHDALPLYLSRPITRAEYVAGKMTVLVLLLSVTSWVPLLLVWALQAWLDPAWAASHPRIAPAIALSGLLWIVSISLLAMALSATFKRRLLAQAGLFAVFFVAAAFGGIVNGTFGTTWGLLLALSQVVLRIWHGLFGTPPLEDLPLVPSWVALFAYWAGCVGVLAKKVRAHEVVK
jgi:ABC-2 type transport system permease protein